jgi:hypothetical protein
MHAFCSEKFFFGMCMLTWHVWLYSHIFFYFILFNSKLFPYGIKFMFCIHKLSAISNVTRNAQLFPISTVYLRRKKKWKWKLKMMLKGEYEMWESAVSFAQQILSKHVEKESLTLFAHLR